MSKSTSSTKGADTSGLGYAYHLPTGGIMLRIRNTLSQFSDLFSEFNKFIAPAYHHDRCERSVHMRLYSMHKREFVMVFLAFLACFGLGTVIGLAGPPITTTTEISASSLLSNTSAANDKRIMATGPFIMRSPLMTTYSQQLWLIARLETDNNDDERFDKTFQVGVAIEGLDANHKPITILHRNNMRNRTRHLVCERNSCDEFTVLHLGFLEYAHYIITVRFSDLEGFHKRYRIKELNFFFKTYNPAFTQIEIWFRFIFLLSTFVVTSRLSVSAMYIVSPFRYVMAGLHCDILGNELADAPAKREVLLDEQEAVPVLPPLIAMKANLKNVLK